MMITLPKGLSYEPSRKRWRVRLYKNNIQYLGGYFKAKKEAMATLITLQERLNLIRKDKYNFSICKQLGHTPPTTCIETITKALFNHEQ